MEVWWHGVREKVWSRRLALRIYLRLACLTERLIQTWQASLKHWICLVEHSNNVKEYHATISKLVVSIAGACFLSACLDPISLLPQTTCTPLAPSLPLPPLPLKPPTRNAWSAVTFISKGGKSMAYFVFAFHSEHSQSDCISVNIINNFSFCYV